MRKTMTFILFFGLFTGSVSFAGELAPFESEVQQMSNKLNRGVWNILTGWMELPRQMVVAGKERGWWAVVPVGVPAGVLMTATRMGVGAYETVFFCSPIDDAYEPIIEPAFAWQKYD